MTALSEEPLIPPRLRRPLAAAWISLGLHAALIALVQVAPPPAVRVGEPAIEARLVSAHSAPQTLPAPAAETPPAPAEKTPRDSPDKPAKPRRAPSATAQAPPVAEPPAVPPEQPAVAAAAATAASAAPRTEAPVAEAPVAEAAAELHAASGAAPAPSAAITSAVDLTYYGARELDVQPRPLREIVPDYPYEADRRRVSGKVRLQLELEADGRIRNITVVSATPPGVFEDSAVKAFRDARFAPAQKNGRPVRARVVIEVLYDWEGRARNR